MINRSWRPVAWWFAILGIAWVNAPPVLGDAAEGKAKTWTLRSGPVEYRLRAEGSGVALDYFGPVGGAAWPASEKPRFDILGRVDGVDLSPANLVLASAIASSDSRRQELLLVLKCPPRSLEIQARYVAWGQTGTITRQITLVNRGENAMEIQSLPSLGLLLPGGPEQYEVTYLHGPWGAERQMKTEKLAPGTREFVSKSGRSTSQYAAWFCLHHQKLGVRYLAQLAWSGNWQMSAGPCKEPSGDLLWNLGMRSGAGGPMVLRAKDSVALPLVALTASSGDLDDAANQLHRYQRQYAIARTPANEPPLVQFNSWYPFPGKMTVGEMKRCADVAAEIGAEVFVLDAGWYNKKDWCRELGDWRPDPVAFPKGTAELAEYVHGKRMKFGIWVEIECLGDQSETFAKHPDWCLQKGGKPIKQGARYHLDFGNPEVRKWARAEMDRLVREHRLDWVKFDYNIDIGQDFDRMTAGPFPVPVSPIGDPLYNHVTGYYQWLDQLREAHPSLVIENCSSGGLRFDLGIMQHTHTNWISDWVAPIASVQLAYGATLEFTPRVCNHWMVGDVGHGDVDLKKPAGWWDFMFRVPMNGQYGISSRVFAWSPELKHRAAVNVELYKRIRPVIVEADVYHLTPPPAREQPTGWTAIQYVNAENHGSVLLAYRLGKSRPEEKFHLRGLDAARRYRVFENGQPREVRGGKELSAAGIAVTLDAEWRAAVIELAPEMKQ